MSKFYSYKKKSQDIKNQIIFFGIVGNIAFRKSIIIIYKTLVDVELLSKEQRIFNRFYICLLLCQSYKRNKQNHKIFEK